MNARTRMLLARRTRRARAVIVSTLLLGGAIAALTGAAPAGPESDKIKGDPYPLPTCAVAGTKLDGDAAPVVFAHEERELRFCCKGCLGKFKKDPAKYLAKVDAKIIEQQRPYYPLDTCLVMGDEPLTGEDAEPVEVVEKNRLLRFCCKGCIRRFQRAPERFLRTLDEAVVAKQKAAYPTKSCLVSGEPLGSMGEPIDLVVANRLVRLCCKGCVRAVKKDPVEILAKLDDAAKSKAKGG